MRKAALRPKRARALLARLEDRLPKGGRIGVGFSGGLDSSCLLALCRLAVQDDPSAALFALHVDHGLRPTAELDRERATVVAASVGRGVPLYVHSFAPGQLLAGASGAGIEAAAREGRYRAFAAWMAALGLDCVALAHHAGDQAEQRLIRYLQGRGERGGMPESRGPYRRPLLDVPRGELRAAAAELGLVWHEDSTNGQNRHLRNQVRNRLLPVVESIFPGYAAAQAMASRRAALDEDYLEAATVLAWSPTADGLRAEAGAFFALHPALRYRALRRACRTLLAEGRIAAMPDYSCYEPWLGDGPPAGATAREARGLRVALRNGGVEIGPLVVEPHKKGYLIVVERPGDAPPIASEPLEITAAMPGESGFALPALVRLPHPGELAGVAGLPDRRTWPVADFPVIESRDGSVVLWAQPWLGFNVAITPAARGGGTGPVSYILKRKELGFST